jgi:hypothetical protein
VLAGEGRHPSPLPTGILFTQFLLFERPNDNPCSQCKFGESCHRTILRSCSWYLSRSQSGAELDASEVWSVQGQQDTCVTNCHPSSNLGRNLFPPRRFSYHTRFSGFNRTAGRVTCDRVQGCTTWLRPPAVRMVQLLNPARARPSKYIIINSRISPVRGNTYGGAPCDPFEPTPLGIYHCGGNKSLRVESLPSSSEHCPSLDRTRDHLNLHQHYSCVLGGSTDAPMTMYSLSS